MSLWGKYLGYSSERCPNCGRVRLENYENGKQICEKCQWSPQEQRYIDYIRQRRITMQDELKKRYEEERKNRIRDSLCKEITAFIDRTGRTPSAIVADLDAYYELATDRKFAEHDYDKHVVRWGCILLLRGSHPGNMVYLCSDLIPVMQIPPREE